MPLIRIEAEGETPTVYRTRAPLRTTLQRGMAGHGPVMILIHGYKHNPALDIANPHKHIFAYAPRGDFKAVSWPTHLGFGRGNADEGLCLPFSWPARGNFRAVYRRAAQAGVALARLINTLLAIDPERKIHIVAHSLGARVFLAALHSLPAGAIRRAVLLTGAEHRSKAEAAMDCPAGRTTEVINVTSRENDLFDTLFEILAPARKWRDKSLGMGLAKPQENWIDVQIDHPLTLAGLARIGVCAEAAHSRFCHWSSYTRHGLLGFYGDLIRQPDALPMTTLKQLFPSRQQPRWSRIAQWPNLPKIRGLPVNRPFQS